MPCRYPLFPGENEAEQLACIMEVLGVPSRAIIEQSSRRKMFFDSAGMPATAAQRSMGRRLPREEEHTTGYAGAHAHRYL